MSQVANSCPRELTPGGISANASILKRTKNEEKEGSIKHHSNAHEGVLAVSSACARAGGEVDEDARARGEDTAGSAEATAAEISLDGDLAILLELVGVGDGELVADGLDAASGAASAGARAAADVAADLGGAHVPGVRVLAGLTDAEEDWQAAAGEDGLHDALHQRGLEDLGLDGLGVTSSLDLVLV
eukprot:CAMPEP_0116578234 /NCGR_PEP_ID=MMETSP0397-20121206/21587_1 /TAXON_ID=216820 /ORGANISM="Cyclophora tenuis, Strain ECT3854" /LENGTH=186 /DNA_ID=CAMNT_0004107589 /DNA_START=23 /DNA_END=581 /DNA_ORIENTATION=+